MGSGLRRARRKMIVYSGSLPAGMKFNSNSTITGTPTEAGSPSLVICITHRTTLVARTYSGTGPYIRQSFAGDGKWHGTLRFGKHFGAHALYGQGA